VLNTNQINGWWDKVDPIIRFKDGHLEPNYMAYRKVVLSMVILNPTLRMIG